MIGWIMLGVLAWGCAQAAGAWTLNHDWRRPVVVLGCVLMFLGFWALLLRRLDRPVGARVARPDREAE